MPEKTFFNKIIDLVAGTSTFLALIALFSMMVLITLDAILNKTIDYPIPGTIEITSYYFMVLVVFLALPLIEQTQSHISADFIVVRFSDKVQNLFNIAGKMLTVLFYGFLAYAAVSQAVKSTIRSETVMSNFTFYIWPARWGVALGILSAIIITIMIIFQRCKNNP